MAHTASVRWMASFAITLVCAGGAGVAASETAAEADTAGQVIFDNLSVNSGLNPAGASPASQSDAAIPFEAGAADDFVLPPGPLCRWVVTEIRWSGVYWDSAGPGNIITAFRIVVWPDAGSGPAGGGGLTPDESQALVVHTVNGNANESPSIGGGPGAFDYSAVLAAPFEARPGVRYWLEIQPLLGFPPQWGWHITHGRQGAGPVEYFDLLRLLAWTAVPDTGDLAFQLVGEPLEVNCDDGDACTMDSCVDGICVHDPLDCDDDNACTEDTCDPVSGCVHRESVCDDGSACTTDSCDPAQGCVFTAVTCDDGSACTADSCDPASGCVFSPISCDDGNPCTEGVCDPASGCGYTAVVCDDGNACTQDACDPASGCVFTPITCDDANACTNDRCDPATGCIFDDITCDDENACTEDGCDLATGCLHNEITCDDDDACTSDTCDPASGCVFTLIECDDGDACTLDGCDPQSGCVNAPLDCDDQDPCTLDSCVGGSCEHAGPPDFNGDRFVDTSDFVCLTECISNPSGTSADVPCTCADLNADGGVDLLDYAMFQMVCTGKP